MAKKSVAKKVVEKAIPKKFAKSKAVVKYKFKPPSPTELLKNRKKIIAMTQDRKALNMVVKGRTYEEIGCELGISTKDAYDLTKKAVERYTKEFALTLVQARELDLQRLQALEAILWRDADMRPLISPEDGKPVIDAQTGKPVMIPGDRFAQKMILDVIEKRSELLGTKAATKMLVTDDVETIRREYVGVDPDAL